MTFLLTLLVDCAGVFEGNRIAAANVSVKKFVGSLPSNLPVRILRYSDTAMWHVGPEPVPAGEIEWRDLPSGGYLSSLAHAVNLAGQTLSSSPDVREVVLLVSDGAMSDPEEIVLAVLARRFSRSIIRAAVPLTPAANVSVLRMFAGDHVFDPGIFSDPHSFLASVGDETVTISSPSSPVMTLSCSVDLGEGNSVSLSVFGREMSLMKEEMRTALLQLGSGDVRVRDKISSYVRRVL